MRDFDPQLVRQFLYFLRVAELHSFSKAAKQLKQSTPTVISQINELEATLNAKLLERSTTGVKLTDTGKTALEKIAPFLSQAESLSNDLRNMRAITKRTLRIGAVQECMVYFLPTFIDYLAKAKPDVTVSVTEIDSAKTEYLLINEIVDIVIGHFDHVFSKDLIKEVLVKENPIVIVPSSHELAHNESVSLERLKDEIFVFSSRDVGSSYYLNLKLFVRKVALFQDKKSQCSRLTCKSLTFLAGEVLLLYPNPI